MNNFLNSLLYVFRKVWEIKLDQSGFVGTIFTDLSKVYDCLPHELLIAKLEAYSLDMASLFLLKKYLANRKQRSNLDPLIVPLIDSNSCAEFPKALY